MKIELTRQPGRLHWDTTHAAALGWMLFLDGRPGDAPTMLPGFATSLPPDASHAEGAHLIGQMLCRETGHLPQEVQLTQSEDGPVYSFGATYEEPA
jgi:hypothetical protein